MAKCLRCGAGNEWLEGKVPDGNKYLNEVIRERNRYKKALERIVALRNLREEIAVKALRQN
jgi:hypothetical protein